MAATTAGALKAAIEGLGLGLAVYRDRAPQGAALPYVTITESVSTTEDANGDQADPAAHVTVAELVSVDLWQRWRDSAGRPAERYGLPDDLARALRGVVFPTVGTRRVYGVVRFGRARVVEEDANVVHDALTLTVRRDG